MNPSETVKAAQRLLAEREAVGLKKYGTTVDRTDLQAGDWLQHAIEEASDLLLYLIRLRETMPVTMREAVAELARPAPAAAPDEQWRRDAKERQLNASQEIQDRLDRIPVYAAAPAPASASEDAERAAKRARIMCPCGNRTASNCSQEDGQHCDKTAERAAYLARWKDAPEWAEILNQVESGRCYWHAENAQGFKSSLAGYNLLGSVRCEPRPVPEEGQGVGP